MVANGWRLYVHPLFDEQLRRLTDQVEALAAKNPTTYRNEAATKLLATIQRLICEIIPHDPNDAEFRQGNTLGAGNRHWFRAKFHERYRLFYRFSGKDKVIVYAWVNNERTLRKSGSKTDPYTLFRAMLEAGDPPGTMEQLIARAKVPKTLMASGAKAHSARHWRLSMSAPTLLAEEQIHDLPRVLGASHATAIVVGTIIGSGIFLVPQEMMRAVGSSELVYLAWIVGGLLSLFGAMTYAELGAMLPFAGGEYVYLRGAYGDLSAFLYMWTWFAVAKPASIASVTTGLARTLAIFPALHWLDGVAVHGLLTITWSQLFAIAATWLITGLNYLGMKKAADFQLFFTCLKGLLIAVIVGACFSAPSGTWTHLATSFTGATGHFGGFMIALIAALWAYDGWNDLTMVAGEVRNPQRNLPIALIAGLFIVGALYMATNIAIQYVLPASAIAASPRPAVAAMALVTGPWGAALVSGAMAFSIFVTLNGTIMSGARIPYAAARDGLFFKRMADVHPRFESPSTSLIVQALLTTFLLLAVGRFQQLFELAIFAEWLFYMITATTVFVYRRRRPDLPRPYRVWGYPVLPALFVVASFVLLVYSYAENWKNSLLGTAVILLGVPLYTVFRKPPAAVSS